MKLLQFTVSSALKDQVVDSSLSAIIRKQPVLNVHFKLMLRNDIMTCGYQTDADDSFESVK